MPDAPQTAQQAAEQLTVWLLWDDSDYYGPWLQGVFASEQVAEEAKGEHRAYDLRVEQVEVSADPAQFSHRPYPVHGGREDRDA